MIADLNHATSDKIGTWGSGDFCASWYNGQVDNFIDGRIPISSPSFKIELFNERKKAHAFHLNQEVVVGYIESPLEGPHKLYLQFFATAPDRIYPMTMVHL